MSEAFEQLENRARRRWDGLIRAQPWIRVGAAICGEAAGAFEVFDALKAAVEESGVNASVSRVGCIGLCYAEPLVDVVTPGGDRVFYSNVTPDGAREIVAGHVAGGEPVKKRAMAHQAANWSQGLSGVARYEDLPTVRRQVRVATRNCGNIDPHDILQYVANGGYSGLAKALDSMTSAEVLDAVKASGLRGRGGAAFPTGVKWGFLAPNPAPVKYVLCNCEEGDPGAFNDKGILESDPHTLLEGLILAGYATNSSNGIIFIRQGHVGPIEAARDAIRQAYEAGLLGKNILGSDFSYDVEVSLTGDSYVAGEETALMEAIEGKRALPRFRPPFPAAFGVWGKPSNINNVKTLAYVPQIVARGPEWFKGIGTEKSAGTAIVCLSGDITYPGMYEVPMGVTIREVLEEVGGGAPDGRAIKVLQTGGPLGGVLGAEAFDTQIDFDAMSQAGAILGSGGIIVGDEATCVADLTRNLVAFNQFESCGKCFPCRLGTTHMLEALERITGNHGRPDDLQLMERMGASMRLGSLCGHGQLGYNPILSAFKYFAADFDSHMQEGACPTGSCGDGVMAGPTRTRP